MDTAEEKNKQRVEADVISRIKSGEAKMRSRSYFITQAILMVAGMVFLLALIFFMVSFILFALQENGGLFAIHFGLSGIETFLGSLPWTLLLLSIALILILALLLKRYAFVYHQPFLYLLLILLVVVSLAGFLIATSSLHSMIYRDAMGDHMSMVGGIYQFETAPAENIYRGQAIAVAENGFILENAFGQTSTVIMSPAASSELETVQPGEYLIIFGHRIATGTIEASGLEATTPY